MRKALVILLAFACAATLVAKKDVLVDFGKMDKYPGPDGTGTTDLYAPGNWEVELASSSRSYESLAKTYCRGVTSTRYTSVLGIRVHFPTSRFNSWARVHPAEEIHNYYGPDGRANEGFGILRNVGDVRSVKALMYGRNFKNSLEVWLVDQTGAVLRVFLGYLYYNGWKSLTWDNPNYIRSVENRHLRRYPLYPRFIPHVKIDSIILQRQMDQLGGDFITYCKDIELIYDQAVIIEEEDIDDEAAWQIIKEVEDEKRRTEGAQRGELLLLRRQELEKMAKEDEQFEEIDEELQSRMEAERRRSTGGGAPRTAPPPGP